MIINKKFALCAIQILMPSTCLNDIKRVHHEEYTFETELYEYRVKRDGNIPAVYVRFKATGQLSMLIYVRPSKDYRNNPCAVLTKKVGYRDLSKRPDFIV